jgi:hypothetical protein
MATLPITDRTPITQVSQITFANSPIYHRQNFVPNAFLLDEYTVHLWVWSGALNKTLGSANSILKKQQVSINDNYIEFELSNLIIPYLNPNLGYNELELPAVSGQAVFWQIKVVRRFGIVVFTSPTYLATTGYRWDYEQNQILGNNGVAPNKNNPFSNTVNKWYNSRINNYFSQSFDFTLSQTEATTSNIIKTEPVTIPSGWSRCSLDPCLILFINKLGLWETFTPNGKLFSQIKVEYESQNRAFRDMSRVDNTYAHYKDKRNVEALQTFVVNTGSLDETMNETVKQIIFSPKVYFIKFKGDLVFPDMVGVTIDNTFITIDDTIVTIDNTTVTLADVGKYKTHWQIPVIVTNQEFTEKIRLNDKNKIDYVLNLDQTRSSIL